MLCDARCLDAVADAAVMKLRATGTDVWMDVCLMLMMNA